MGFKSSITRISDGTPVNAATTNPCLDDLQGNILYLKALFDNLAGGQALITPLVAFKSDVEVANPVFWNDATGRYELALADGSHRADVAGLCSAKSSSAVGDLFTSGYKELDISDVLNTGESLEAGRYYLSRTEAGKLTITPPSGQAIPVLISDGQGNVILLPQTGARGFQGYRGHQGYRGYQGFRGFQGFQGYRGHQGGRGYQGILSNATALGSATGTTTDSYVEIYDSGDNAQGILFVATIKNTGANNLSIRRTVTDAFGVTDNGDGSISAGDQAIFSSVTNYSTAYPPFTRLRMFVKSTSSGQHTTYDFKLTRTVG